MFSTTYRTSRWSARYTRGAGGTTAASGGLNAILGSGFHAGVDCLISPCPVWTDSFPALFHHNRWTALNVSRWGPGVAGKDPRDEPPKSQIGKRDLADAEMRLVGKIDGNWIDRELAGG